MATFTAGSQASNHKFSSNTNPDGTARKTFPANIFQLTERSHQSDIGGQPETLKCLKCDARFVQNERICGPTRRRGPNGSTILPPVKSNLNPKGYVLRYWHEDCNDKFGTKQGFSVNPGTSNGWQSGSVPTPTPTPAQDTNTSNTNTATDIPVSPAPVPVGELDDLLKAILGAVASVYDPKIDDLKTMDTAQAAAIARINSILDNHKATQHQLQGSIDALRDVVTQSKPLIVEITSTISTPINTGAQVSIGLTHKTFSRLQRTMRGLQPYQRNVWLAGPAGSGKTSAAKQLSQMLFAGCQCERCLDPKIVEETDGAPHFWFCGAIASEYKLAGFYSANGVFMSTQFYQAYKYGGVFLFDEVDRSMQGALLAFNAALANGFCDFPEGRVKRHPDCYILAAANTWGMGADANYSGAANIDKAFLSRFPDKLAWDYDEELEHAICENVDFVDAVQAVRARVFERGEQYVIDPRQSMAGCQALKAGLLTPSEIVDNLFGFMGRTMETDMWNYIGEPIRQWLNNQSAA